MPLFFFIIGFILIDSGVRGNAAAVGQQFASDVKGFLALCAVVIILGGLGAFKSLRPVTKGLLGLVFVVFCLRNGNQIVSGIESAVSATTDTNSSASTASNTTSAVNNASSEISQAASDANTTTANVSNLASTVESVASTAAVLAALA